MTINTNGYVCFGENEDCGNLKRPSPHDLMIGLNYDLDTTRNGSGQIYYQNLNNLSTKLTPFLYVNLLNTLFVPENVFMITFDNVLPFGNSNSRISFQIFLLTDSIKPYVTFKYTSCPNDLTVLASSGLNYNNDRKLEEFLIGYYQECTSSNVKQDGIWVIEVNNYLLGIH